MIIDPAARVFASNGPVDLGSGTWLDYGAIVHAYAGSIRMGARCYVGPYAVVYGQGSLSIGDNVMIAAHSLVIPDNHRFANHDKPIRDQGTERRGITIESDVWVAGHVVILDGVTIGSGAVIAAGAVVTKDVPSCAIVAGVPADVIGQR